MLVIGLLAAYLVGAFPTGLLFGKWFAGVDLRQEGSRNIGFTNAWRVVGWKVAVPVLAVDVGKGLLAVLAIPAVVLGDPGGDFGVWCGLAALLGNMCNVFLRFKGGKGVATGLGVFAGLAPLPAALALGVFVLLVAVTRYISLGSVCAAVALTLAVGAREELGLLFWFALAASLFVIFKHRENLRRLRSGTESRFGRPKSA